MKGDEIMALEMKMSDKFNGIYELVEVDNKDAIVREIKALQNFTEEELSSIFGSSSVLWILENYDVSELKEKVRQVEENIVIKVGDIIRFKMSDDNVMGIILNITGISKNRCTALCYYKDMGYYKILEGISSFDIEVVENYSDKNLISILDIIGSNDKSFSGSLKEGDL